MNHYQKAQEFQRAKNEAVFLCSCNLTNLITEIRDLAQVRIYGTSDKWLEAVEKLPRLVFKTLPRLVLELQDALKYE